MPSQFGDDKLTGNRELGTEARVSRVFVAVWNLECRRRQ